MSAVGMREGMACSQQSWARIRSMRCSSLVCQGGDTHMAVPQDEKATFMDKDWITEC